MSNILCLKSGIVLRKPDIIAFLQVLISSIFWKISPRIRKGNEGFVDCNTRGSDFQILAIEADFYYTILQFYKESRCLSMYLSENISVRFEVGLTLL